MAITVKTPAGGAIGMEINDNPIRGYFDQRVFQVPQQEYKTQNNELHISPRAFERIITIFYPININFPNKEIRLSLHKENPKDNEIFELLEMAIINGPFNNPEWLNKVKITNNPNYFH